MAIQSAFSRGGCVVSRVPSPRRRYHHVAGKLPARGRRVPHPAAHGERRRCEEVGPSAKESVAGPFAAPESPERRSAKMRSLRRRELIKRSLVRRLANCDAVNYRFFERADTARTFPRRSSLRSKDSASRTTWWFGRSPSDRQRRFATRAARRYRAQCHAVRAALPSRRTVRRTRGSSPSPAGSSLVTSTTRSPQRRSW